MTSDSSKGESAMQRGVRHVKRTRCRLTGLIPHTSKQGCNELAFVTVRNRKVSLICDGRYPIAVGIGSSPIGGSDWVWVVSASIVDACRVG